MSFTTFRSYWYQVGPKFAMEMAKSKGLTFPLVQLWCHTIVKDKYI